MLRYCVLLILCPYIALNAFAQSATIDSLQHELKSVKSDILKLKLLSELCWQYGTLDKDSALLYGREMLKFSKKKGDTKYIAQAYNDIGIVYLRYGEYPAALKNFEQSLSIREKLGNIQQTAATISKIGLIYQEQGNIKLALEKALSALILFEKVKDTVSIGYSLNNIGNLYEQYKDYSRAFSYYSKALKIAEQGDDKQGILAALVNSANVLSNEIKNKEALSFYEKALKLAIELDNLYDQSSIYNNIGTLYRALGNNLKGIEFYSKALKIGTELDDKHGMAIYANNIGNTYADLKNYDQALKFQFQALALAQSINTRNEIKLCYQSISDIYAKQQNYKKALEYHHLFTSVKDSVFNDENARQIAEMQTKYDSEKKEQENVLLAKDNEVKSLQIGKQTILRNILIASILLLFSVAYLVYNRYKLKQRTLLNATLLKQEQLRLYSVIATQEQERKRIAGELHDGIGQMLAAVKLNVEALKDAISGNKQLNTAVELIDESCVEIRNISHNIMPGILVKSGLSAAVKELAERINHAGSVKVFVESDEELKLNEELRINLFRVIQELVSNILKYAAAKEIQVQLNKEENSLTILIEDNGKGFDKEILKSSGGNGWNNISSRMEIMKGRIEIDSTVNKGTAIFIEVPLV